MRRAVAGTGAATETAEVGPTGKILSESGRAGIGRVAGETGATAEASNGVAGAPREGCPLHSNTGNVGALIIRIGFWGILYYRYNKEPQDSIGKHCPLTIGPKGTWSTT